MQESISLYTILGVLVGWLCSLSSGVVIGYIVFRTKRDPSESLFKLRHPKAQVFNVEEPWEQEEDSEPEKTPEPVAEAADRFREQAGGTFG